MLESINICWNHIWKGVPLKLSSPAKFMIKFISKLPPFLILLLFSSGLRNIKRGSWNLGRPWQAFPGSKAPLWPHFLLFFFFFFFRAAPTTYGSSQAGGRIGAVAASLCHSHSNTGSGASSVTCTTVHGTAGSLTHWARPRIQPASSWILVGFLTPEPLQELMKGRNRNLWWGSVVGTCGKDNERKVTQFGEGVWGQAQRQSVAGFDRRRGKLEQWEMGSESHNHVSATTRTDVKGAVNLFFFF